MFTMSITPSRNGPVGLPLFFGTPCRVISPTSSPSDDPAGFSVAGFRTYQLPRNSPGLQDLPFRRFYHFRSYARLRCRLASCAMDLSVYHFTILRPISVISPISSQSMALLVLSLCDSRFSNFHRKSPNKPDLPLLHIRQLAHRSTDLLD